jgi:oligosaccharide repeat unit polymerase
MDSLLSNINIVLYILAWIVTIVLYHIIKKSFDAGSILLFTYLIYAIASLLLYNSPFYRFNQIRLFPFIYLFLILLLVFWPILKYNDNRIDEIQKVPSIYISIFSLIFIIASLVQLPTILSDFSVSISRLLNTSSGGLDLYNEAMSESRSIGDGKISNLASIISNSFGNFGILLFFYYLTRKNRSKLILIGLFISSIISIPINISLGQRGPILETLLSLIITYYALRRFFQPKVNRIIKIAGMSLLLASLVPVIALTISRFGNNTKGSMSSVYFYGGQQNLYFNNYGIDNGGIRYGDRTFPLFKRMLGFENVPKNFMERRDKYPHLKMSDENFYTFVGDFTLDFGPITATFILLLFSIFVVIKTRIRDGAIRFHQLILLHFVMTVCMVGGLKLFPYSDVGGNLQLSVYFLAYMFFRLDYNIRFQRRVIEHRVT